MHEPNQCRAGSAKVRLSPDQALCNLISCTLTPIHGFTILTRSFPATLDSATRILVPYVERILPNFKMNPLFKVFISLVLICEAQAATIRGTNNGEGANATTNGHIQLRSLASPTDFSPLTCNANLATASCATTWSSMFGTGISHSERVTFRME